MECFEAVELGLRMNSSHSKFWRFGMLLLLFSPLSVSAQEGVSVEDNMPAIYSYDDPNAINSYTFHYSYTAESALWEEDFTDGIPSSWENSGFDGYMQFDQTAVWEYRGPNTQPDVNVGSRGAYSVNRIPINSPSAQNGFVIFDSDYLDNGGNENGLGMGPAPAPHVGTLTTEVIDLSGSPDVMLELASYARVFFARLSIVLSNDGGVTWNDTISIYSDRLLGINRSSENAEHLRYDVSDVLGGSPQARIRFVFDGRPGNISGSAYYFWMIDDIRLSVLPEHALEFVENHGAPANDIVFSGDPASGKYGYISLKQSRAVSFDANILNFGSETQTNVKLIVQVWDDNDNLMFSDATSGVCLMPGDTLTYNHLSTQTWRPITQGVYKVVYLGESDSVDGKSLPVVEREYFVRVTDSVMSLDFGNFDNSVGTDQVGHDASAIASRFDLFEDERLFGVRVGISPRTVPGGIIEVTVYDSTGFNFVSGFPTQSLAFAQYTVTADDVDNEWVYLDVSNGKSNPVYLETGKTHSYYVVVTMFSNNGRYPIFIKNDETFPQPTRASLMYFTHFFPRWYTGFAGNLEINAPHIRMITCPALHAAACMSIGVQEVTLSDKLEVYPNPANDRVYLEIGDLNGDLNLSITDVRGRTMITQEERVSSGAIVPVSLEHFTPGVYLLTVTKEDAVSTYRITVQ